MIGWILDRVSLYPSRHAIPFEDGKVASPLDLPSGRLDVYRYVPSSPPAVFILKFPGNAGRAERMSSHPAEFFRPEQAEVWCVNPPGYGLSAGRAGLRRMAVAHLAVAEHLLELAAGRPVLVCGRSMGTVSTLMVAARLPVAGIYVRDPVPLRQVIRSRYPGYRRLGVGLVTGLASTFVPREFDTLANAGRATAPAAFVLSGRDRMIPPALQEQVLSAYAGPKAGLTLAEADHDQPPLESERPAYARTLAWLARQAAPDAARPLDAGLLDDVG